MTSAGSLGAKSLGRLRNLDDVRDGARRRLPRMIFDFVDGGAEDELTMRRNRLAFDDIVFHPHVLVDVAKRDISTELFGRRLELPVIFGPAGLQGLIHRRGELAAASAAGDAGTVYVLSFGSSYSIEEVAKAATGPLWLQLSPWKDRSLSEQMLSRCAASGYEAVCLTVDVAVGALRERDLRNGMTLPFRVTPRNAVDTALHPTWLPTAYASLRRHLGNFDTASGAHRSGAVGVAKWVSATMNPSATWDELAWLRSVWSGKLLIKGVQRADDARRARDAGVDGVIVSNHGGRQLDGVPAAIDSLPAVAEAVGAELPVILDGGVRRGSHVVKAIALGATAVSIGRPYVLSLAFGDAGPRRVLDILRSEIDTTLALLGSRSFSDLDNSMITRRNR